MTAIAFPKLSDECSVVWRGDDAYTSAAYQYAMSTFPERVYPAVVVTPRGDSADSDVAALIRYASAACLSIAIRTGGHQYSGASSTWGDNLQLDLSEAYTRFEWSGDTGVLVVGVSLTVSELMSRLGKLGMFVPHGLCGDVHIGGHAQTGGYGMLCRSFGLFADHIEAIDIITADAQKRHVRRDTPHADEAELFFATLGGSPGNFGVVTQLHMRPQHDKDFPSSRGLKLMAPYNRELTARVMQSLVDFACEDPRGMDYQITLSSINPYLFEKDPDAAAVFMSTGWHDDPFRHGSADALRPSADQLTPVIYITMGFGGIDGADESTCVRWFDTMRAIFGPHWTWISRAAGFPDGRRPLPLSLCDRAYTFKSQREFSKPYVKIAQNSFDTQRLNETGFVSTLTAYIDDLVEAEASRLGLQQVIQFTALSNANGVRGDPHGKTAFAWHNATVNLVYDVFYDVNVHPDAKRLCEEKQRAATAAFIGADGCFSTGDYRWLWGSHGDYNMDKVWSTYMPRATYERVLAAKRHWDRQHVFSANPFCVGWSAKRARALSAPHSSVRDTDVDISRIDDVETRRWFAKQRVRQRRLTAKL